jgi:NAD(P)-dependent dehydrogenase (short-subunit alcohol dehydrogenase family)
MNGEGLEGRVAIVTGAASGIGAAVARRLGSAGAAVAVADIDDDRAERVVSEITSAGGTALAVHVDVGDEAQWAQAVASVRAELGPPTLLHSNAALMSAEVQAADRDLTEMPVDLWDRIFGVNVRGGMLACKHVLPSMVDSGGGSVVITASITALSAPPYLSAYVTTKGALMSLARSVASSFGAHSVRCNAVAPGVIETPASAGLPAEHKEAIVGWNMIPRMGQPEDIAKAVTFLLSEEAAFITGQVLVVDGGATVKLPG